MIWNKTLTAVNYELATLYPLREESIRIVSEAGLSAAHIQFSNKAVDNWHNILTEATKTNKVNDLIQAALNDYPGNVALIQAKKAHEAQKPNINNPSVVGLNVNLQKHLLTEINELLEQDNASLTIILRKAIRLAEQCNDLEYRVLFDAHLDGIDSTESSGSRIELWPDKNKQPKWDITAAFFQDRLAPNGEAVGISVGEIESRVRLIPETRTRMAAKGNHEGANKLLEAELMFTAVMDRIRNRVGIFTRQVERNLSSVQDTSTANSDRVEQVDDLYERIYSKPETNSSLNPKPESSVRNAVMTKTVLELDLVGYSTTASTLEENIGPSAVSDLNEQIQSLIDKGLEAIGGSREETVISLTGDGAILFFDEAEKAHHFATTVHEATREHNRGKIEASAIRLFRMGAATGDIALQPRVGGGYEAAGVTIARAVRLEAAARPGELVIDAATFEALPTSLRVSYSAEERIRGKRSEEFRAHRCVMNHDVSPKLLSSVVSSPKEAPGSRRSILELFEKLSPNDLERLIFLLEMPIKEQPSKELTSHERENRILQYFTSEQNGLAKLESELKYLIEKQSA